MHNYVTEVQHECEDYLFITCIHDDPDVTDISVSIFKTSYYIQWIYIKKISDSIAPTLTVLVNHIKTILTLKRVKLI